MPNWCTNILTVSGPADSLDKFFQTVTAGKEGLDFNTTVPMPPGLEKDLYNLPEEEQKRIKAENLKKYGSEDWYNWCVNNWGVKWNASEVSDREDVEGGQRLTFSTPWGPPVYWMLTTSKIFPDLTFSEYFDDGSGGYGKFSLSNGQMLTEEQMNGFDWLMECDPEFKETYESVTQGEYEQVISEYAQQGELEYYDLEEYLFDRIKREDLPKFKDFNWQTYDCEESYKVLTAEQSELPTLFGSLSTAKAKGLLEQRISGQIP